MRDGAGNRQLATLGPTGVEAIYLEHTSTPFEIKNERNELQGMVREMGLYVGESGLAGSVQQINLVVEAGTPIEGERGVLTTSGSSLWFHGVEAEVVKRA